jgi:hypothetical protein
MMEHTQPGKLCHDGWTPRRTPGSRLARIVTIVWVCLLSAGGSARAAAPVGLGVNLPNAPGQRAPLLTYVKLARHPPAIVMWYQQFSEPLFYPSQMDNLAPFKSIPMITWDPMFDGHGIALSEIARGGYDAYIRSAARLAAGTRSLIYVRFAHEMNLGSSPFGPGHAGDNPAAFRAAWRRVVSIFRQEGARNVEWVWSPNVDCAGRCPFTRYYPGRRWVDWVALDGYNYGSADHTAWRSFQQIFLPSYRKLVKISSKPVMIGETASTGYGGNKARWITQAFRSLPSRFPRIRAIIWFDRDKETDWQVDSSAASLRAWQAVTRSPAFSATPVDLLRAVPSSTDVTSQLPLRLVQGILG